MIAHLASVLGETDVAAELVGRFESREIRRERGLRVDHDLFAARQIDDDVGAVAALVVVEGELLFEVAIFQHAGEFEYSLQLQLAPAAAGLRLAQGLHQISSFGLQGFLGVEQGSDLGCQRAVSCGARLLQILNLLVHAFQRFGDGLNQILDGLFFLREVAGGLSLIILQNALGKLEEIGVVAVEGRCGKRLKLRL